MQKMFKFSGEIYISKYNKIYKKTMERFQSFKKEDRIFNSNMI
jgi:hypothetical protein